MEVILIDKFLGYCPGLKRSFKIAHELADKAKRNKKRIYFDVPLAHNENVEKDLADRGFKQINLDTKELDGKGNYFLVSAHGASYDKIEKLRKQNFDVLSATCPTVRRSQDIAIEDYKNGYQIVLFGKKDHAEIVGVNGCVDNSAIVFKSLDEAKEIQLKSKASILCQTTFPSHDFEDAVRIIQKNNPKIELLVRNTVCPIVEGRIGQVCKYAAKIKPDMAVVVGSTTSSNTKQLSSKLSQVIPTLMVGDDNELSKEDFQKIKSVLVVSGTSAPPEIVHKVAEKLKSL